MPPMRSTAPTVISAAPAREREFDDAIEAVAADVILDAVVDVIIEVVIIIAVAVSAASRVAASEIPWLLLQHV